jgi:hypothetical protein
MNESGSQENRKKQSRFLAKAFGAADENKLRHSPRINELGSQENRKR